MGDFIINVMRAVRVHDIVGMGFAGVAAYGLVTGHLSAGAEQTAVAMAAAYLGLRANGSIRDTAAKAVAEAVRNGA